MPKPITLINDRFLYHEKDLNYLTTSHILTRTRDLNSLMHTELAGEGRTTISHEYNSKLLRKSRRKFDKNEIRRLNIQVRLMTLT